MTTCIACGAVSERSLCGRCLAERRAHRAAKAKVRAERMRARLRRGRR